MCSEAEFADTPTYGACRGGITWRLRQIKSTGWHRHRYCVACRPYHGRGALRRSERVLRREDEMGRGVTTHRVVVTPSLFSTITEDDEHRMSLEERS